jgi:2-C-methyl-D-erythritol 4-phosphate cytidylyltransferase
MNIAIIFAGGTGKRMKTNGTPKQFLEIDEVPIIIHTLNIFENAKSIDAIVIACISSHIEYLRKIVKKFEISKVKLIVKGGKTGQESIINGLKAAEKIKEGDKDIVLIHDGVRPIIDEKLIDSNIENVKKYGTSISCLKQRETTAISVCHDKIEKITDRENTYVARAPQTFYLKDILDAEEKSMKNNDLNCIDSCSVMMKYGKYKQPHITECLNDNIKITTPEDYYIAQALLKQRKNKEVWGI